MIERKEQRTEDTWDLSLLEKDGKAYLIYNNIMSPSIANNFIKRNPSPGIREYEADGSWYTLERIQ